MPQRPALKHWYRPIPLGLAFALSLLLHLTMLVGLPDLSFPIPQSDERPPLEARFSPPAPLEPPPQPPREQAPKKNIEPTPAPAAVETIAEHAEVEPAATTSSDEVPVEAAPAETAPAAQAPAPPAVAEYPFRVVSLIFDLHYGESGIHVGEVRHRWEIIGDRYVAESVVEAVGLAALFYGRTYIQRSEGTVGPAGLIPALYTQIQSGKEEERVEFDWTMGMANLVRGAQRSFVPLNAGTQDLMSVLHQLYFLQPLAANSLIAVATPRRLDTHLIELLGEETIELPAGTIRSLHLKRLDPGGGVTEIWVDQDRSYLPVRIFSINRKGVALDYRLQSMVAEHPPS